MEAGTRSGEPDALYEWRRFPAGRMSVGVPGSSAEPAARD